MGLLSRLNNLIYCSEINQITKTNQRETEVYSLECRLIFDFCYLSFYKKVINFSRGRDYVRCYNTLMDALSQKVSLYATYRLPIIKILVVRWRCEHVLLFENMAE